MRLECMVGEVVLVVQHLPKLWKSGVDLAGLSCKLQLQPTCCCMSRREMEVTDFTGN